MLDAYLTLAPSGLESVTIDAIKDSLSNFTCHIKQLDSHVSQKEIDTIKEKVLQQQQKKRSKQRKQQLELHSIYDDRIFGTCKLDHTGREVNIGFQKDKSIISTPGGLEGKSVIQFDTDAPPETVAMIREMGCGPLMALVVASCNETNSKIIDNGNSVDESIASLSSFLDSSSAKSGGEGYQQKISSALNLWARHAERVWFRSIDVQNYLQSDSKSCKKRQRSTLDAGGIDESFATDAVGAAMDDLRKKIEGVSQMKYRVSCLRAFTKDYKYKRDELTPHLASILIPQVNLSNDGNTKKFTVDLENYDFELVTMIKSGTVYVSIALNYYQYVGAKSYSCGKIPPDISMPYIKGEVSKDVIRLRPSIASLLYRLCEVETGDIVVDPCAGVGTIPVEGSLKKCFALGGDLVLNGGGLDHIATAYSKLARDYQKENDYIGVSDLISWDASLLPIRDGSVDVIMSDLPFGVKCLSSKKLKLLLPLLFAECGRCLRPGGRMTLLCGSFLGILEALQELSENGTSMFESPSSIIPVNIGGLSAWILQISRTRSKAIPVANKQRRIFKMIKGRSQSMQGTNRRVQA